MREPKTRRLKASRPSESVPNPKLDTGPLQPAGRILEQGIVGGYLGGEHRHEHEDKQNGAADGAERVLQRKPSYMGCPPHWGACAQYGL